MASAAPAAPAEEHPHLTLLRRGVEAFASRDLSLLEELCDEAIVWHYLGAPPFEGDYHGLPEIFALFGRRAALTNDTWSLSSTTATATDSMVTSIGRVTASRGEVRFESDICTVYRLVGSHIVEAWTIIGDRDGEERLYR